MAYSKEWFFRECNQYGKAIAVLLRSPIEWEEKELCDNFTVHSLVADEEEQQILFDNILKGVNTNNGIVRVRAFKENMSPFDCKEIDLDLGNILETEKR